MSTSYAIDVLDNFVREELPSTITESLPKIAPVYKYIEQTSLGVVRSGIGRDWEVEHLFGTGLAGLIQHADPRGPSFYSNVDSNSPFVQSVIADGGGLDVFPSPTAVPHTTSLKRIITLQMTTGNLAIPVTWFQGDILPASQIKQVVRDVRAVGQLRAITEAQSFFMPGNNTLARLDDFAYDSGNKGFTLSLLMVRLFIVAA